MRCRRPLVTLIINEEEYIISGKSETLQFLTHFDKNWGEPYLLLYNQSHDRYLFRTWKLHTHIFWDLKKTFH